MTPIYLFGITENYPNKLIGIYNRDLSPDSFLFCSGKKIEHISHKLIYEVDGFLEELSLYDNVDNNALLPLVSPRIQMLLTAYCPDDIQFLDTIIQAKDGSTEAYKTVNITHTVNAVNYAKSDCVYMEGEPDVILRIRHLVLRPDCLGKHSIARDSRLHSYILISDKLRQACIRNNIKGIHFKTVQEYNNFDFSEI